MLGLFTCLAGPMDLPAQAPSPVPAALEGRVGDAIARLWQVPAGSLQLEWGHLSSQHPLSEDAGFRLLGQGDDGQFVVAFALAGGQTLAIRLRAGVTDSVLVAARPLSAGVRIGLADLAMSTRLHWGAPRRSEDPLPGPGWLVKRPLAVGGLIAPPAVVPPPLVEAGAPIKVQWESGAVSVAVAGVAVNAAALGQPIQVRTSGRSGLVHAIVTGPGTARMER
jgi:flagella basal body P-ring formation protein FlgA